MLFPSRQPSAPDNFTNKDKVALAIVVVILVACGAEAVIAQASDRQPAPGVPTTPARPSAGRG